MRLCLDRGQAVACGVRLYARRGFGRVALKGKYRYVHPVITPKGSTGCSYQTEITPSHGRRTRKVRRPRAANLENSESLSAKNMNSGMVMSTSQVQKNLLEYSRGHSRRNRRNYLRGLLSYIVIVWLCLLLLSSHEVLYFVVFYD